MIIKPEKTMRLQILVMSALLVTMCIPFYIKSNSSLFGVFPLIPLLFYMPWFISSSRTFIMDRNGCTVHWLWYKKHYRWDELKLKQYVHYRGKINRTTRGACYHAAEFCPKKVNVPKNLDGHIYSSIFHPLSFIFIYFPPNEAHFPIAYEMNREVFQAKLEEWGVEMEYSERGSHAYDPTWHDPN